MASVDAVAMPSRREPYGLVALEALAAGRPLLVSAVDGLRDHAANGAVAVERPTVEAWADALARLSMAPSRRPDAPRRHAADADRRFAEGWARLIDQVAG
jgi:glycosyltransferase involved in cell wall biosynthesis